MASKTELRARYKRLTDKVSETFKAFDSMKGRGPESDKAAKEWLKAVDKADAFLMKYDF